MSSTELQDTRLIIVGAGGAGIGEATAKQAAAYGARLVIVDRDADEADRVTSQIQASGGEAYSVQADITDDRQVHRMVTTAVERLGGIDGAFNNVGGSLSLVGELHELRPEDFEAVVRLNLVGTFLCLRHQIPALRQQGAGSIVNNASALALVGTTRLSHYVAAKHGVLGLTRSAAIENGPHGIRVNAVLPGVTATSRLKDIHQDEVLQARANAQNVLGRIGTPEEVGQTVCFLLSSRASNITGAGIAVDGGWTAR